MWILDFFSKKQPPAKYPASFGIIDWSPVALELGVKGDRNKLIFWYRKNRFGNVEVKKYRYSQERVFTLQNVHKIPIFDKTKLEARYPVFARVLPGETQAIIQ